jgi:hypothetical protein
MASEHDPERDLAFTIKYALAYLKNWLDGRKAPSMSELDGLARDVLEHLLKSNYRIEEGPPARDAGSWPSTNKNAPLLE